MTTISNRRLARMFAHRFERMAYHFLTELGKDELNPQDPKWDLVPGEEEGIPNAPVEAKVARLKCGACALEVSYLPTMMLSKALAIPCPGCGSARVE